MFWYVNSFLQGWAWGFLTLFCSKTLLEHKVQTFYSRSLWILNSEDPALIQKQIQVAQIPFLLASATSKQQNSILPVGIGSSTWAMPPPFVVDVAAELHLQSESFTHVYPNLELAGTFVTQAGVSKLATKHEWSLNNHRHSPWWIISTPHTDLSLINLCPPLCHAHSCTHLSPHTSLSTYHANGKYG